MNWRTVLLEIIGFCGLFTVMVFGMAKKDPAIQVHNYPPKIQEEYFKTHEKLDVKKRNVWMKLTAIIFFTVIFVILARLAGAKTFLDGFLFGVIIMASVGLYDTFVLDWICFANMKMFRLPGTEHMDREYHEKWFHLKGILWPGSLFGLIVGILLGAVIHFLA